MWYATMNPFLESNPYMIFPLGPPNIKRRCSNTDNPDYDKPVLLRTFKVADSQSIWKICSDHKDDPIYDGTYREKKSSLLREVIYQIN